MAAVVRHRIEQYQPVPMPWALDLVNADGREPAEVCALRRSVAHELIQQWVEAGTFNHDSAWDMLGGWTGRRYRRNAGDAEGALRSAGRPALLDSGDFVWLYRLATDATTGGRGEMAEAFAVAAATVFDLADDESATLVLEDRTHRVWKHVSWWFDPVPLDSEVARCPAPGLMETSKPGRNTSDACTEEVPR
ncbi:hypothetical protein [Dactylosporangium sp. CA-092794]|uniref:hypothetical protein n=1 Tax=Dactylosporangium sp. CA-092794 TaxID=3239929 RepID=UPI003D8F9636